MKSKKLKCDCGSTEYKHLHDEAHGLSGTHVSGSERYECKSCGKAFFSEEGKKRGFKFFID